MERERLRANLVPDVWPRRYPETRQIHHQELHASAASVRMQSSEISDGVLCRPQSCDHVHNQAAVA